MAVFRSTDTVDPLRPVRLSGAKCHVESSLEESIGRVVFYYPQPTEAQADGWVISAVAFRWALACAFNSSSWSAAGPCSA